MMILKNYVTMDVFHVLKVIWGQGKKECLIGSV